MTKQQVLDALGLYELMLSPFEPARHSGEKAGPHEMSQHLRWMIEQTRAFIEQDRVEKSMRWLGFIQGGLWALGYRSIEAMKRDNMPTGDEFNPNRI